ncbi:tRNA (adenosine(37)-N6)-threonylcarbamoyltransferase complex dimerization subunit type 1 TsaB [Candidatus Peregrinibacteria bacterium]|jgi:tRNA threonylcarbamoyl adenosine modification protein YeaZ|nr:tRNA (adenosine(37)-N6)-threonylcarbamoyltransferase complex dimerization subunit type 1 TsaB [Candidatus Peregrinibacteria bacterium]
MSLILAINTASKKSALALIKDSTVLAEHSWESNANESQNLLPGVLKMFEKMQKKWEDLDEVFVVKGPGAYTSLRVGIVIANAIAWQLKIPMRTANVFEIWEQRIPKKGIIAIQAGRDKYLIKGSKIPQSVEELEKLGELIYGEIPFESQPQQVEITFGKAVAKLDFNKIKTQSLVEPFYVRAPNITTPKKSVNK